MPFLNSKLLNIKSKSGFDLGCFRFNFRTVCFNTEGTCILSGSAESVKIWNRFVFDFNCVLAIGALADKSQLSSIKMA